MNELDDHGEHVADVERLVAAIAPASVVEA
jgi:hypothetical protein